MLIAYAVAAWHRTWCRGCSTPEGTRWIEVGEPVGFVAGIGVCCPGCYVASSALVERLAG